jgi:23S rRNA (adenine-N6)-dimethyltransferase
VAVRRRPTRGAPGQHFLRSSRLASAVIHDARVAPGDLVVEIGAGSGILTKAIAEAGARVVAIELDPALASKLRQRFAARPSVTVLEVDALQWSWPHDPFSVVSNLPFTGSGAILSRLLGNPRVPLRRADVIVQWEAAAKLAAVWPATLRGTFWKAWYELAISGRLARSAFSPPPGVDAGVLRVTRRPRPLVAPEEHELYWQFVASAFRVQAPLRKALRPHLSPRELKRLAPVLGFAPDSYPRDLDAGQWASLFAFSRTHSRL